MTATVGSDAVVGRRAGTLHDIVTVAGRAVRAIPREPEVVVPALVIPIFFFVVNVGALQTFVETQGTVDDFKAFQLPVAIVFAVTGISRAPALVTDIQSGYFDRLLLTPVRRLPLLFGLMVADLVLILALTVPVIGLGLLLGVRFATGPLGILCFMLFAAGWGVAFNGFSYAIALKTGNPAAVNSAFLLFFPFAFLTTAYLPQEALTGWMETVAKFNPVTYLLEGLRALVIDGWETDALLQGGLCVVAVGVVSLSMALAAMRGRIAQR